MVSGLHCNVEGLDLAQAVRRDDRWQGLPMIALSSHANANDVAEGRAAGFDEYLSKADQPRLPENLARAMDAVTHKSQWRAVS